MGSETELPAASYRLPVGPQPRYTANLNLIAKVLDFVKFGGPCKPELRTFRWEILI